MAINIRRGFHRVSLLIQILYALAIVGTVIGQWNNATDTNLQPQLRVATPAAGNYFDQFDAAAPSAAPNPFDQFDAPASTTPPVRRQSGPWDDYAAPPAAPNPFAQFHPPASTAQAAQLVSQGIWEARRIVATKALIALLVGLFCWRLFAFTIGWLWDGFAKQSDVM